MLGVEFKISNCLDNVVGEVTVSLLLVLSNEPQLRQKGEVVRRTPVKVLPRLLRHGSGPGSADLFSAAADSFYRLGEVRDRSITVEDGQGFDAVVDGLRQRSQRLCQGQVF